MGAVHGLRVKSPYKLLKIKDIKIENKPNEHGYLYLKALIDDSVNFNCTINASTEDEIFVYEEETEESNISNDTNPIDVNTVDESKSNLLFNGIVQNIRTSNEDGIYYLEIEALTISFELDIKEKSRSFQNAEMTYDALIGEILKDYSTNNFAQYVGNGEAIGKQLFQYKETDWNFLKRIASELNSELYCDIIDIRNMFYFGRPSNASYELEDTIYYKAHKNLKRYYEEGGIEAGNDTDYFYYELEKKEQYNIGDEIYFKQKDLYVNQYSAYALKDEIIYKYRLCRKNGIWQTKLYNSVIGGTSLEGKVLAVDGEKVKLHLNIDESQNEDEASWFPYAPPTGNIMYSMPIVGTSARLYFPSEESEDPIVTGCVRSNGSSCAKTSDTTNRYFGTEHGSEIEMTPGAVNIKGGSKEPLSISFDDSTGVTLKSPKNLNLSADADIIIKTPASVKVKAQSQIGVIKAGTENGFSLETDMHFKGSNVIKDGSDRETYAPFDDEPKAGTKPDPPPPPPEEKKGFSWGSLLVAAVAVVAVVAVVATCGVGAVLVGAAIGACVGAACAVASTAMSDHANGTQSSLGTYIENALKGAATGAISGAIFGPFGSFSSVGGVMAFGAVNGMADSILNQAIEGKFSLQQTLFDGLIGAATGGLLHGAGKLVSEASPFVKNAFSKVISKNETSLLNVAKKIDDFLAPVAEAVEPMTGRKILVKMEGNNSAQDTVTKLVEKANNNILVNDVKDVLISSNKFTKQMANQLEKGVQKNKFAVNEVEDSSGKYKLDVLDSDGNVTTSAVLDSDGNTIQMSWIIDNNGKRGTQYTRADIPDGMDPGHIKSVQEGAKDNCIEDSPINIIAQTEDVNRSSMRWFENYRASNCKGMQVTTDILPDGYVRVQVPEKNIDVTYNPLSTNIEQWPRDWYLQNGEIFD